MIRWTEIDSKTYWAIFHQLDEQLGVFGTITNLCDPLPKMILTEWGFSGEDRPLIKSEITEEGKKFFIIRGGNYE